MLVRDVGDSWQLVLQSDHGDLSGQLAATWADHGPLDDAARDGLHLAAIRHDDGWGVWDRRPRVDPESGRPLGFLDVSPSTLLSAYRACVDVVCDESRLAGLFVSMHVTGLRRNRYGLMGDGEAATPIDDLAPEVADFVRSEEARQARLAAELEVADTARWHAYRLLQVYDVVSLYCGLADLRAGESRQTVRLPAGDSAVALSLEPAGPYEVRCDPFPFVSRPARFEMLRRLVPKRSWPDDAAFRADFAAAPVERVQIAFE
jgi:hypothetical protein